MDRQPEEEDGLFGPAIVSLEANLCGAWGCFSTTLSWRHHLCSAHLAASYFRFSAVAPAWRTWIGLYRAGALAWPNLRQEALLARALTRWLRAMLGRAWSQWRSLHLAAETQLAAARRALQMWLHRWLLRVWNQWRSLYLSGALANQWPDRRAEIMRNALELWLRRWLLCGWNRWRLALIIGRSRLAAMRLALWAWRNRLLWQAWRSWYQSSGASLAMERAARFWLLRDLARGWNSWRARCLHGLMLLRRVWAVWSNRALAAAWNTWQHPVVREPLNPELVGRALQLWRRRWLGMGWHSWRARLKPRDWVEPEDGGRLTLFSRVNPAREFGCFAQRHVVQAATGGYVDQRLESIPMLVAELARRGLSTRGLRLELQQRLLEARRQELGLTIDDERPTYDYLMTQFK